jgi:hypothetical protein
MNMSDDGPGKMHGENRDASSQFTISTSLFFDGQGPARACRITFFSLKNDRSKVEPWPQKTTF